MKPVALPTRAIQNSSVPGDIILDPFGGSGSTLLACEVTGRRACLMELAPQYCDVIVKRWEQFTGRTAERIEAGAVEGPTVTQTVSPTVSPQSVPQSSITAPSEEPAAV